MSNLFAIAGRLAEAMKGNPWYHRTSICDQRMNESGPLLTHLRVWGEFERGEKPDAVPDVWEEIPVRFCRVTPEHECPFGSVRASTRSEKEQDSIDTPNTTL